MVARRCVVLSPSTFPFTNSIVSFAATATYRLHPHIALMSQPPRHLTQKFQSCFSPGVIRVNPRTGHVEVDEKKVRNESMSREVLRHPEFEGSVKLGRVRDWFLCTLKKSVLSIDS